MLQGRSKFAGTIAGGMFDSTDSTAAVESDRGDRNSCCWFTPEHKFRQVWDGVQVLLLFYVALMVCSKNLSTVVPGVAKKSFSSLSNEIGRSFR